MANFCPQCGGKSSSDDRFCKNCGVGLTESAGAAKEESRPEKPSVAGQVPSRPAEPPVFIQLIKAGVQILILGLFLSWAWYSYGCATGKYPNTGDQMCKSFYQTFNGGGGGNGGGGSGRGGCIPTGCPSYAPWNGCGKCWPTSNLCHTKGTSDYSENCSTCRKCP